MTNTIVKACDVALNDFREAMDRVMRELEAHRNEIADYDELVERHTRASNAGVAFTYEAAVALHEVKQARESNVLELMRPHAPAIVRRMTH